jgi:hypothetical protein
MYYKFDDISNTLIKSDKSDLTVQMTGQRGGERDLVT